MKIRYGFISNSSSASFIIAYKENISCPHCGRKDPDILDMINDKESYDNNYEVYSTNKHEIINEINDFYLDDKDKLLSSIKNINEKIESIAYIKISQHDEFLHNVIFNKKGSIRVLYSSND